MTCERGHRMDPSYRFCPECGAPAAPPTQAPPVPGPAADHTADHTAEDAGDGSSGGSGSRTGLLVAVAVLAAAAVAVVTGAVASSGGDSDPADAPAVLPPAGTSTCVDDIGDGNDYGNDLPKQMRVDITEVSLAVGGDSLVVTWNFTGPVTVPHVTEYPLALHTAMKVRGRQYTFTIGNYMNPINHTGLGAALRIGDRLTRGWVQGTVTHGPAFTITATVSSDTDPNFTREVARAGLGQGFRWRTWAEAGGLGPGLWIDTCPGAGEFGGDLPFEGRQHLRDAGPAPGPVAEATPIPDDTSSSDLTADLDQRLIAEWEGTFRQVLEESEPMVAKAYVDGSWWAIADYCEQSTGQPLDTCYDLAADYLEQRLGELVTRTKGVEIAGAVAIAFDHGYDLSAAYLDLPSATLETSLDRPHL